MKLMFFLHLYIVLLSSKPYETSALSTNKFDCLHDNRIIEQSGFRTVKFATLTGKYMFFKVIY